MIETAILLLHLLVSLGIIVLILLQQGKGAEAGASFGAGASGPMFGSEGSSNFLSKLTAILVAIFFISSLSLAYLAKQKVESLSLEGLPSIDMPIQEQGSSSDDTKEALSVDEKSIDQDVPTISE